MNVVIFLHVAMFCFTILGYETRAGWWWGWRTTEKFSWLQDQKSTGFKSHSLSLSLSFLSFCYLFLSVCLCSISLCLSGPHSAPLSSSVSLRLFLAFTVIEASKYVVPCSTRHWQESSTLWCKSTPTPKKSIGKRTRRNLMAAHNGFVHTTCTVYYIHHVQYTCMCVFTCIVSYIHHVLYTCTCVCVCLHVLTYMCICYIHHVLFITSTMYCIPWCVCLHVLYLTSTMYCIHVCVCVYMYWHILHPPCTVYYLHHVLYTWVCVFTCIVSYIHHVLYTCVCVFTCTDIYYIHHVLFITSTMYCIHGCVFTVSKEYSGNVCYMLKTWMSPYNSLYVAKCTLLIKDTW